MSEKSDKSPEISKVKPLLIARKPEEQIVATLSTQLSWSHFIEILPIKTPLAREFYAEMCRVERWPVRTLRQKIGGMLYERTALFKNTEVLTDLDVYD